MLALALGGGTALAQDASGSGETFTGTPGSETTSGHGGDFLFDDEGDDDYLFSAGDYELFGSDNVDGGSGNDTCVVDEDDTASGCENLLVQ